MLMAITENKTMIGKGSDLNPAQVALTVWLSDNISGMRTESF
jgi:hypothetical protein